MNEPLSSTWFTVAPHWQWYIVFYFFIGGLAGGCYFIATLIDMLGRPADRPLARLGYYVAFPAVLLSGLLLTLDLTRPLRFWHMLVERNTGEPMFKAWSPMSVGSWALVVFGLFSLIAFLGALAEEDRVRWPALHRFRWPVFLGVRPPSVTGTILAVLGGIAGLFIAGYTGVLLAVTNRPIWSDTPLLGLLFVVSAASTSAALMMLLAHRYRWSMPGIRGLLRMDTWVLVLELLVVIAVLVSLGPVARAWLSIWGVLLLVVVAGGIVAPLVMSWRHLRLRELDVAASAVLVLIGGFLIRVVVIFASETI